MRSALDLMMGGVPGFSPTACCRRHCVVRQAAGVLMYRSVTPLPLGGSFGGQMAMAPQSLRSLFLYRSFVLLELWDGHVVVVRTRVGGEPSCNCVYWYDQATGQAPYRRPLRRHTFAVPSNWPLHGSFPIPRASQLFLRSLHSQFFFFDLACVSCFCRPWVS